MKDATTPIEAPTDPKNVPTVRRIRTSGVTGIILGLSILAAVNFLWFSNKLGFMGIHPHPYWLVVLPMAARYGFQTGAFSGVLAGLTLLGMQKLGQPDLPLDRLLDIGNLTLPVLFISGGILLGEIREAQKRRHEVLEDNHKALITRYQELNHRYDALNRAKQELDTHIISQEQTLTTVYEAAKGLKSLQEKDIYPAVVEIVVDFLSADACSIYILDDNRLVLMAGRDADASFQRKKALPVDEGLVGTAVASRQTVSLNTLTNSDQFADMAAAGIIICVPLLNEKQQVLGVLNIEKLPFIKFNPESVRLASIIGEWCGSAIENARTYQDTRDKNISDDVTGAYTYPYFRKRLREEFMRSRRYGQNLSLIVLDIDDFKEIEEGHQQDILTVISLVFQNKLRAVDMFFHDQDASRYYILLPGTALDGARVVDRKMIEEIEAFKFRPYRDESRSLTIRSGISEFNGDMEQPNDLVQQAAREIG
ncbi:MAG: hypothetical protein CSA23_05235 [Deltaproteobacteria bacterium]|nr:MAG: hypothetical protein CSA23_05235 [Deltaproteobacteria bacterium]